jgi:putative ABC transport system permease protein
MNFAEILRQVFATFRAHKMRTFLTMFGIVWGIASVILLVGLGKGFATDQHERWRQLGVDLVIFWGGRTSQQAGGLAAGRPVTLTIDDARLVKSECHLARRVSPELDRTVPETSPYNSANRTVVGIWPEFQQIRTISVAEGRLLNQQDEDQAQRVVLLGYEARKQLFPGQPAVGATLNIQGVPYTVVGVLPQKKQNSDYNGRDDQHLFAAYSAVARDFPPPEKPGIVRGWLDNIVIEVAESSKSNAAVAQVRRTLARVHHFDPQDQDAVAVWDTMEMSQMIEKLFDVITLFFGIVAVITLCLGGIGVMNIMLVAVTERTREIGLRKAIGATRGDILRQFFAESVLLTITSGALGFAVGGGFCFLLQHMSLPEFLARPEVSTTSIVASILTLSIITVAAGMYPAQRAAEMTPVDSLRYE